MARAFALFACCALVAVPGGSAPAHLPAPAAAPLPYPILFVTQVPIPADFTTIGSVFGNHLPDVDSAGRGGDLWILYPSGQLRNLTKEAGFGVEGFQGAGAIAVREPAVDWTGTKALFSMVVGATTERYEYVTTWWQIYEVTGLAAGETAQVRKLPGQPAEANNVSPIYGTDGRVIFTSDRPRSGERHHYPQLDEYEEVPTNTGLWSLDPASGDLRLLDHAPSGAFRPLVDSFGRVVYTRWDHLERDQQADADALEGDTYGTFDYADESAGAARLPRREEVFPEPRRVREDLLAGTPLEGHSFNHFFPWQINEDGSELETLNHLGRHELHEYFNRSRHDDDNLEELIGYTVERVNPNPLENLLQIAEDPRAPGRYLGIDAPEFETHASGRIVALAAPPERAADAIAVEYLTHPATRETTPEGESAAAGHSGHYRSPLPLADGTLVAVHAAATREDRNEGTRQRPRSRYAFRLKRLEKAGAYWTAGAPLTPGIRETISYWDPDELVEHSGELWELDPVAVRPRAKPATRGAPLPAPEAAVFAREGVDPEAFRAYMRARGLGLVVTRNVTTRDALDRQQPFNLRVAGGGTASRGSAGREYAVSHLQLFQGDQVRGLGGIADPRRGRRVLARVLHDDAAAAANRLAGGAAENVAVAPDGSVAAFVPAHRAVTWQLTDPAGEAVVRERYWLTVQTGEVRVCPSCHGPSSKDQEGRPAATNEPEALARLLRAWKASGEAPGPCVASPTRLCLRGGRFKLEVSWRDFDGKTGAGHAVPLTADTGAFWFFDDDNLELAVKVLDGRGLNGKFWVFYGALSSVEYTLTVTDTQTGAAKTYRNPPGQMASVGDTQALPAAASVAAAGRADEPAGVAAVPAPAGACVAATTRLCLQGGRFAIEVAWRDFDGNRGAGRAVPLTADTGSFWFFDEANVELMVKVLDGRGLNGKFWVFYGALSSVEYTLTVTDTATGRTARYENPSGRLASRGDTGALPGS